MVLGARKRRLSERGERSVTAPRVTLLHTWLCVFKMAVSFVYGRGCD